MPENKPLLMACTVGGAPRPIAISIIKNKPDLVVFFASAKSERSITQLSKPPGPGEFDQRGIVQLCEEGGFPLEKERYTIVHVDPQDLENCVEKMRRGLEAVLDRCAELEPELLLDITGGTKLMSAALALVGRNMPCKFSYVAAIEASDGTPTRTKNDLGITIDGKENVLRSRNPWDALGYQSIEDAVMLGDGFDHRGAARLLDRHRLSTTNKDLKLRLKTWMDFNEGYAFWDQFNHEQAYNHLARALEGIDNIEIDLGESRLTALKGILRDHLDFLSNLTGGLSDGHVVEFLSISRRRAALGRFAEAVMCGYRAIEVLAHIRLSKFEREDPNNPAKRVPYDLSEEVRLKDLPDDLRKRWGKRGWPPYGRKLGLQECFILLQSLGDDAGRRFVERKLHQPRSPFHTRHKVYMAHGLQAVPRHDWKALFDVALALANLKEEKLTQFPKIGSLARGAAPSRGPEKRATGDTALQGR